jgi:hypothetical protein
MGDASIRKASIGAKTDDGFVQRRFPSITVEGSVEVRAHVKAHCKRLSTALPNQFNLPTLIDHLFQKHVEKNLVCHTEWEKPLYSPLQLEYAATDAWGHLKLQQLCDESQAITRDADDASECSETEMDADDDSIRMSVADADVGGDDDGGASEGYDSDERQRTAIENVGKLVRSIRS